MPKFFPSIVNWYTYKGSYLNITWALMLFIGEIILATLGFMLVEGFSLGEAFYMTIITISTVGYSELHEMSASGRWFTSLLIIVNIGIFAYAVSAFTSFVVYGEFFKKMHFNVIGKSIKSLNQHVIICGYGKYGLEIIENFHKHKVDFVVIDHDEEKIEHIQKSHDAILYIEGDATEEEILLQAGIKKAKAIICALDEDSSNVFAVITARQLNPNINIISRARLPKSGKKLMMVGANHIIRPEQIGGFYMASLVNKPGAVEFFTYITNEAESDIKFEELAYEKLPRRFHDVSIRNLKMRQATGVNIIGFKQPNGSYIVNPGPDTRLVKGSSFIVLGSKRQLEELRVFLREFE